MNVLVGNWTQARSEAVRAVEGLYGKSYIVWYYKGVAEYMLDMYSDSEMSLSESNYLKETKESKQMLYMMAVNRT